MNYILITLTGLLGVLGIIKDTHDGKELANGEKTKKLNGWGYITLMGLAVTLSLTIYKQYIDNVEAEEISRENNYLKLSDIEVGLYFAFTITLSDSFFQRL